MPRTTRSLSRFFSSAKEGSSSARTVAGSVFEDDDVASHAEDDDLKVEHDGAAALVDVVSLALLNGSEIDFADELAAAEFRVKNPNAKSSCGCGVSFSI